MKKLLLSLLCLSGTLTFCSSSALAVEYLVISGGPALRKWEAGKIRTHDVYWGNFVDTAMIRMGQLKPKAKPGDKISWLVYRPAYVRRAPEEKADLLQVIQNKANAIGVQLFWFDTKVQLLNYINNGNNRTTHPIASLDFFGHSNKVNFMFDYSNALDGCSQVFLHTRDLVHIKPSVFAPGCTAQSWGCHSGEYYSAKFSEKTGVKMWGAIGKTDYAYGGLPVLSKADGRWTQ